MNKKLILVFSIIVLVGWCNLAKADIVPIGTINYGDEDTFRVNQGGDDVDLEFVFSTMDEDDLTFYWMSYDPELGSKYFFESNEIEPEWWMVGLGEESFYFQDVTPIPNGTINGTIYEFTVNYSSIEIPPSPWEINLTNLTILFNHLTETLNITSANYTRIFSLYNSTLSDLQSKISELETKQDTLNALMVDYAKATDEIKSLNASLGRNISLYKNTFDSLINASIELSHYRLFHDEMTGYKTGFWFDDEFYTTSRENQDIIEGLRSELGTAPLYTILAIVLTALVLFFIFKVLSGRKNPTAIELERDVNYKPESRKIDHFVNFFKPDKKTLKDTIQAEPIKPKETQKVTEKELPEKVEPKEPPKPVEPKEKSIEEIFSEKFDDLKSYVDKSIADAIIDSANKEKVA